MVIKKYEKLFEGLEQFDPLPGLFDKIILAIRREQEVQKTKKLLFGFFSLLIISFITIPFSWRLLVGEIKNSGIFYFIFMIFSDFAVFLSLWQDFAMAIIELLPVVPIVMFTINMVFLLFILRLFLCRKRLLSFLIRK